ncbi:hypothetical protein GCM10023215_15530 [Pseudonocardia yuanmonensis]|uniref:HNH endonuclease n=1 Tax=Pseudonocardia yuanmonensis TaxID=1095914 RepID=A0ABP8W8W8_9PSEU
MELARGLWQGLNSEARVFLTLLAMRPDHRFLAETVVAVGRLDRASNHLHSVLSGAGTFCKGHGIEQIWQYDNRTPRSYWMDQVQAELLLQARRADVEQGTLGAFGDDLGFFSGQLTHLTEAETRGEQRALRLRLLRGRSSATCALCSLDFPSTFLVAAHIKQRSECTENEQRDWNNIAMLVCLFGCDKLYEDGFVSVDGSGAIRVRDCSPGPVLKKLQSLQGGRCLAFTQRSAGYFAWHRENVFVAA